VKTVVNQSLRDYSKLFINSYLGGVPLPEERTRRCLTFVPIGRMAVSWLAEGDRQASSA